MADDRDVEILSSDSDEDQRGLSYSSQSERPGPSSSARKDTAAAGSSAARKDTVSSSEDSRDGEYGSSSPSSSSDAVSDAGASSSSRENPGPWSGNEIPKDLSKGRVRQIYVDLIDSCQEFQTGDGMDKNTQQKMSAHIEKSQILFENVRGTSYMGPGEMYIACSHTRLLSEIIRHKSAAIGSASGFSLDSFLLALKDNHRESVLGEDDGDFSTEVLARNCSYEQNEVARTVPALCNFMGAFDKNAVANPKVKKTRAPRTKKNFEETNQTKHVKVNASEEQRRMKDQSAVQLSMDLLRILKIYHHQNNKALGLYNFTMDKGSLARTVKHIFYLSFLVRDGRVSISKEEGNKFVVKPETPPPKGKCVERQQYIFSITARQWKALALASQGENIITAFAYKQALRTITPGTAIQKTNSYSQANS